MVMEPKTTHEVLADELARSLPTCEPPDEADEMSLCDLVVTALEHHEFTHFRVRKYVPSATGGLGDEWAIVEPIAVGERQERARQAGYDNWQRFPVKLDESFVRYGVYRYALSRLDAGMPYAEVRNLILEYADVEVADAIIQFAVYDEVLLN